MSEEQEEQEEQKEGQEFAGLFQHAETKSHPGRVYPTTTESDEAAKEETEPKLIDEVVEVKPTKQPTKAAVLKFIQDALAKDNMTQQQAKELRFQVGVTQGDFTRKKESKGHRKARHQLQKDSRRRNRGLGKGQKRTGG